MIILFSFYQQIIFDFRWLPTVVAAAYDKLLINVALGFDSYLVMRHGHGISEIINNSTNETTINENIDLPERLGCYFCSDVVAATNSQRDRTLDQQCTVTRPGLSFSAASLAIEMMVSLIQSTKSNPSELNHYPVYDVINDESDENEIFIPHQIRGSFQGFTQMNLKTPSFPYCTACCPEIIKCYQNDKIGFIRNVCNNSKILEEISGITKLMSTVDVDLCIDSDEDF